MVERDEGVAGSEHGAYDRRRFLRQAGLGVAGIAGAVLLDGGASSASPFISRACGERATAPPMLPPGLLAAAKKEGTLNLIADPYNWANYGTQSTPNTVIGEFYKLYGINCPVVNPDGTSAQELTAILSFKGTPQGPRCRRRLTRDRRARRGGQGFRALQGADLERDPEQHEGPEWRLVRRLLRRPVLRHEHQGREEPAEVLEGPPQAGVQGPGRDRQQPCRRGRCLRRGLERRPRQRRVPRQHHAGPQSSSRS